MRWDVLDEHTIVISPEQPGPYGAAATRIDIAQGKVVAMHQYATREEALAGSRLRQGAHGR